jgi:hypothetical protein
MTLRERVLYHQIHPLKLAVDVTSSLISTWLIWRHQFWLAMAFAWVLPIIVSSAMLRWMDFSHQRDSSLGRYIAFHMTRTAEALRMSGQIVVWLAAWRHAPWAIAAGVLLVIVGWTYSLPTWRSRA